MPKRDTEFEHHMDLVQQGNPEFRECWRAWLTDRKARRKPVTDHAAKLQLEKLSRFSVGAMIDAIKTAIECGYQTFWPKEVQNGHQPKAYKPTTTFRHD